MLLSRYRSRSRRSFGDNGRQTVRRPATAGRLHFECLEQRTLLSIWGHVGPEIQVPTTTTDDQVNAVVASDSDGDFVVVWQSDHGGDWDIYGQRFDATGQPQGSEFLVNTTTSASQSEPDVAMDDDGDFVVTWFCRSTDDVLAQRFDTTGTPLGSEIVVNSSVLLDSGVSASVAMDADGDFVVAWNTYAPSEEADIFARRFDADGQPKDAADVRVNATTSTGRIATSVSMDSDGDFVVAWNSSESYYDPAGNIFARRFDETTESWAAEFEVNDPTSAHQHDPSVAVDDDGDFVIAWLSADYSGYGSDHNVKIRRYDSTGAAQGSEFQANEIEAADSIHARVTVDADGDFVVVWESSYWNDGEREFAIVARRYDRSGVAVATEFAVTQDEPGKVANPAVATDAEGNLVVAWDHYHIGVDNDVHAQRFLPFSAAGSQFLVNTTTDGSQGEPAAAMDDDGNFVVVWESPQDPDGSRGIYGQRFDTLGVPQGTEFLVNTTTNGIQKNPSVAMDENGNFVVAWQSDDTGDWDIYAQRFDASGVPQGSEFRVNTTTDDRQRNPSVALDADGDFVVAWDSGQHGYDVYGSFYTDGDIVARRYSAAGTPQGDEFQVSTTTSTPQARPAVAMDVDGDFVVAWESGNSFYGPYGNGYLDGDEDSGYGYSYGDVRARRYDAAGVAQGDDFQVNTTAPPDTVLQGAMPAVAMDHDGDFVVAWAPKDFFSYQTNQEDLLIRRFDADGVALSGETKVNTTTALGGPFDPAVAMDADGDFVVTWSSYYNDSSVDTDMFDIMAQRYDSTGAPLGANMRVNSSWAADQEEPTVAVDADGDFVVAWARYGNGDPEGISAQRFEDLRPGVTDDDNDGVTSDVEDGAPNGGDGNDDGILDSEQPNVTSLPNVVDETYVTLASPADTEFTAVVAIDNPSPGDAPQGVDFPVGFFEYTLGGLTPGAATTVTEFLSAGQEVTTYYKYGPEPGNATDHWYEFLYDGTTGAEILADRIVLHFVDGQRGDDDLTANGVIVEPGAPAFFLNVPPVATDDTYALDEDNLLSTAAPGVLGNDTDDNQDLLTAILVTDVSNGVLILNPDGAFSYTPGAGFTGSDSFTYMARDPSGADSDVATVTLTVNNLVDLSGRVFDDVDNDGLFEPGDGDAGIEGVRVEVFDQASVSKGWAETDAQGEYMLDVNLNVGTYRIVEILDESTLELLDGKETAGTIGGQVDNLQDSNEITFVVGEPGTTADGTGYNFAEIQTSEIVGLTWQDFNNDGEVNFGETAIDGVTVTLQGTDDRGNPVAAIATSTDMDGVYMFYNLRPGTYTMNETQPAEFDDGLDLLGTVNGIVVGDNSVNDVFSGLVLPSPASIAENYNFGERPPKGGEVIPGQTATIGFWQNRNGQELIEALNGSPAATQLGDWLAASFPNMYGLSAAGNDLSGATNEDVADFYRALFRRKKKEAMQLGLGGPVKMDAHVMAVTFATYVTNENLAGTVAAGYGFLVTDTGVGTSTFNVGEGGEAFGVTDYSDVAILDLLFATNDRSVNGVLYDMDGDGDADDDWETLLRTMANDVYSAINEQGDI